MYGVSWEVRADVRDHNLIKMPVQVLVQYAQRRSDVWHRRHKAAREEREAEDAERRTRRLNRRVAAATPQTLNVSAAVGDGPQKRAPYGLGSTPMEREAADRARHERFPCQACNSPSHWTRECPQLSFESRAAMDKANAEREAKAGYGPKGQGTSRVTIAAVPTSLGSESPRPQEDSSETTDSEADASTSGNE